MKNIVISGFDSWGDVKENPSWEVVKNYLPKITGWQLKVTRLPVDFKHSFDVLKYLIDPETKIVLCFGVSPSMTIDVETVARKNIKELDEYKADSYESNLPVKSIVERLKAQNISTSLSGYAGMFACNYVFYRLLDYIHSCNLGVKGGFIHIPFFDIMKKEVILDAIDNVIDICVNDNENRLVKACTV